MMLGTFTRLFLSLSTKLQVGRILFFQTEYIIQEVLGQDGSHTKRDVVSMLNLFAEAHVIKKVVKQRRDYENGYFLMRLEPNQS